ncbi:MAG: hypothetical protein D6800_14525 [Candidatus Zixiibacteriota bacterium]|nr:MAG: hypothetical protein D6800_14525 [candidate division Zixibacteria bacterium]
MFHEELLLDGETCECEIQRDGERFTVTCGGDSCPVERIGEGLFAVTINGQRKLAAVAKSENGFLVDIDAWLFEIRQPSEDGFAGGVGDQAAEKDKLYAPMPGKIVKVLAEVGDEVHEKQTLVIVEAMKMENPVVAKAVGRVKAVNCAAGDQVDTETPLIELELAE